MTVEASGFMRFEDILVWIKRATGIGYKEYPPIEHEHPTHLVTEPMRAQKDKLVKDVERLEVELRRRGYRTHPYSDNDD